MNITEKLVDQLAFTAGSDVQIDLPTDGLITQIDLEETIQLSATPVADMSTLGMWRTIQSLKIQGGGGTNYFSMAGVQMGVLLHFLNLLDFWEVGGWRSISADPMYVAFRIHFGSHPRDIWGRTNPFDLSAAIPADEETGLKLTMTCAGANVMDDTITVTNTTTLTKVTVHKVQAPAAQMAQLKSGMMVPVSSTESYDPGATKSSMSGQRDVPTGGFVRRIAIAAQDDTAVGSYGPLFVGDQVTELGIKLSKENRWIVDSLRTQQLTLNSPRFDGGYTVNLPDIQSPQPHTGLYCLDLRDYDHKDYGLDTRRLNTSDVKLAMTIGAYASGEVEQIWYDQLLPYTRR